jgi:hypothetical protein
METEYNDNRELELFEEYARQESLDAFLDELAMKYCGDVYIASAK